jgi:hypothetical protein
MVRGLNLFRQAFADHASQFVLIGGTADLHRFLDNLLTDGTVDPRALGLRESLTDLVTRIRAAYA